MKSTDIIFELFNYCNGTCTGCMLSSNERKQQLYSNIEDIKKVIYKLKQYGVKTGYLYRPIFSFGDTFKLNKKDLFEIFDYCNELNLPFGTTVTGVDQHFLKEYEQIAKDINCKYPDTIIDITIDPFRIKNDILGHYKKNIKNIMDNSRKMHIQVLISNQILNKFSPKELINTVQSTIGKHPFLLTFLPTVENLDKSGYRFEVISAYEYTLLCYQEEEYLSKFYKDELRRFTRQGEYSDCLKNIFHISHSFNLYPISYTIFGDFIRSERNNIKPLGNVLEQNIEDILTPLVLRKINIENNILMEESNERFDCQQCSWLESCKYSGIGLVRKNYKEFESKIGHCYGPGYDRIK